MLYVLRSVYSFNNLKTTEMYSLSLHDALPISCRSVQRDLEATEVQREGRGIGPGCDGGNPAPNALRFGELVRDRKSTRLNSSHVEISYAVFCLKKKNKKFKIDEEQWYRQVT